MVAWMEWPFIKRPCYLKFGEETFLQGIRLRADCFFRHWPLKDGRIDEEGFIRVTAARPRASRRKILEVSLCVDPVTGLLLEYRYTDNGATRVFTLTGTEYLESAGVADDIDRDDQ